MTHCCLETVAHCLQKKSPEGSLGISQWDQQFFEVDMTKNLQMWMPMAFNIFTFWVWELVLQ
jgi:hypothetical protein